MRPLPTIGQVITAVRQETAKSQMSKQAAENPEAVYISDIARGLHEVAAIVKSASVTVTYDDVINFGYGLLRGGR
jgi:hypothetical protein